MITGRASSRFMRNRSKLTRSSRTTTRGCSIRSSSTIRGSRGTRLTARICQRRLRRGSSMRLCGSPRRGTPWNGRNDVVWTPNTSPRLSTRPSITGGFETKRGDLQATDSFLVACVAANTGRPGTPSRKSYPQMFEGFAMFLKHTPNARLYIHAHQFGQMDSERSQSITESRSTSSQLSHTTCRPAHTTPSTWLGSTRQRTCFSPLDG